MKPFPCSLLAPVAAATFLLWTTGCDRGEVKVYHATHEDIAAPPAAAPAESPVAETPAAPAPPAAPAGQPVWDIPADWHAIEPGPMLLAKFQIGNDTTKANVNISQLTGDGGGLAANITRWRAQIGLNPLDETALSQSVTSVGAANVVDFTGTENATGKPTRLVAAVVPQNGQTWFYKLMGDETIVAQQKDAFLKFVQTAKYNDAR